jgi:hypothetical protein
VTLLSVGPLSCAQAMSRFAAFLQDFDGRLPSPRLLDTATGTFVEGSARVGFRVEPAVGPPTPSGGGTHPEGRVCPGSFRVLHDDRIGRLRLPAGRYRITLAASRRPGCAVAARLLSTFLQRPSGRLPRPWRLDAASARFSRAGRAGFRIEPAAALR